MNRSLWARLKQSLDAAEQWYRRTPQRSLAEAYQAAQAIKKLEEQHFKGQTIDLNRQGDGAVSTYFQTKISQYLQTIRMRLTEYRFSSPVIAATPNQAPAIRRIAGDTVEGEFETEYTLSPEQYTSEREGGEPGVTADVLEQLRFIDSVLTRYEPWRLPQGSTSPPSAKAITPNNKVSTSTASLRSVQDSFMNSSGDRSQSSSGKLDSNSFIPRSILKTANRFRRELDPDPTTEEDLVRDFRMSKVRTRAATRFLVLLIVLPLLTQQISKAILIGPIVDRTQGFAQIEEWVNPRVEERIFGELSRFEEKLKYQNLLADNPRSASDMQVALKARAEELQDQFQSEVKEPVKNIFSDLLSLVVFAVLVLTGRQEIDTLKSFFDEMVYGLSDSAKAFIIILFTDVFVGFHSPHGWEVIIESGLEHFGLPLNRSFINMFIATFPVMLDTVFKYWIFRYLNQLSPSAVATYRSMNE
jgi:CemA family